MPNQDKTLLPAKKWGGHPFFLMWLKIWDSRTKADLKVSVFLIRSKNQTGGTKLNKRNFEGFGTEQILQTTVPIAMFIEEPSVYSTDL